MDKQRVADALEEVGLLLELLGENPFKTRAYLNGARIVRGLDEDLAHLVQRKGLTRIKGIGAALAEHITQLVREESLPYLDQLRAQVPSGLLEWLKIQGLGAKKARAIHVALGISTLGELEYACRENRLRDLPGFGEASQRRILAGIEQLRRHAGRFHQPVVLEAARHLLAAVRAVPGVRRAEVCGSVRRRLETSKDVDLLVSANDAHAVMDAFCAAEGVQEVTGRGPTKCSVRLGSGPAADLRVVEDESYACALLYFTGSKAHNIALRGRAQKSGLKLNEYGLTREDDGERLACPDETAVYRALGLDWIAPELREDQGEVEAAAAGELPTLIEESDLRGVLHVHSNWSDGSATIAEMAQAARAMGMRYLGLCDHSQSAAYAGGLDAKRVRDQQVEVDRLNRGFEDGFRVLKGIEVDILPDGRLDFPDEVLAGFDVVVASVHSRFRLSESEQTTRLLRALDNRWVDILGHVTGRLLLARDGYAIDLTRILDAAAERGVAVEINAHPHRLDLDWRHLRYGLKRGVKTCVNPDAHSPRGIQDVTYGVGVARKGWCGPEDVLNAWPLERLLEHLRRRRQAAGASRS